MYARPNLLPAALLAALVAFAARADTDLAAKYPATLEPSGENIKSYSWTCSPDDVWKLSRLKIEGPDGQLKISLDAATVAFGVAEKNVVWAAVFPDSPGKIETKLAGDGEKVTSIWLRFHPSLLPMLFPAATVTGKGDAKLIAAAKRLAAWKTIASWQADSKPMIPTKNSIVIDVETGGTRRFYMIDREAATVKYEPAFEQRRIPADEPVTADEAAAAVQKAWDAFDAEYAMFGIRKKANWNALKTTALAAAKNAKTRYDVAAIIADMVTPLEDLHIGVTLGNEWLYCYNRERPLNGNWKAIDERLSSVTDTRGGIAWGRSRDGLGYVNIYALNNKDLGALFDQTLEQLADTWGLIIDLRFNGGGDELLGRQVAGRFLDKTRVYSINQYRNGPKHEDLGPKLERSCEPRGPWRYQAPVVVLFGQRTMSSAESFALMLAQCPQVTTMGDRTAGASANPRQLDAGLGIMVNLPRWIDMLPDGKPLEPDGIAPSVKVTNDEKEFSPSRDPVIDAALSRLRGMSHDERKAGKR